MTAKPRLSYAKWSAYRRLQQDAADHYVSAHGHLPPPGNDPLKNYDLEPPPMQTKAGADLLARIATLRGDSKTDAIVAAVVDAVRGFVDRRTAALEQRVKSLENQR